MHIILGHNRPSRRVDSGEKGEGCKSESDAIAQEEEREAEAGTFASKEVATGNLEVSQRTQGCFEGGRGSQAPRRCRRCLAKDSRVGLQYVVSRDRGSGGALGEDDRSNSEATETQGGSREEEFPLTSHPRRCTTQADLTVRLLLYNFFKFSTAHPLSRLSGDFINLFPKLFHF